MERNSNAENREKLCLKLFSRSPDISCSCFRLEWINFIENKEEFLII